MSTLDILKKHLRRGSVYRRADLERWSTAVDRHLGQLVEDGTLQKLSFGLYHYPKESAYGPIPPDEADLVRSFLKDNDTDLCNTRLVMINPQKFCYLVASVEERIEDLGENNRIIGYYGEFGAFLKRVNECLENAKKFCYNDLQGKVIDNYMECFRTGDIKKHLDSQINWVKDKKPNVEFNLGWMNNLIDPLRNRCTFEVIY